VRFVLRHDSLPQPLAIRGRDVVEREAEDIGQRCKPFFGASKSMPRKLPRASCSSRHPPGAISDRRKVYSNGP
jgi:hypothetical protein